MNILKERTKSLCPTCFQEIPAQVYEEDNKVYMSKRCSQHGDFNFLIEKDAWIYKNLMNKDVLAQRRPFNSLMIAVTHSCNLNCPICYLPNRDTPDLSLEDLKKAISNFDGWQIRLSGGEPTLREDLPQIVQFVSQEGKMPVLITNGLRLADRNYVKELKTVGLKYIHFSFDGFSDTVYKKINGRSLLKIKLKALENLKEENMSVRLSIMLVKGVNEKELKKIYRFCIRNNHFINALRIRTKVASGRYTDMQQQIYLSDIVNMMSEIIGVSKEDLVEYSLLISSTDHLPCQLNLRLLPLLLRGLKIKKVENSLFKKIKIIFKLLPKIGLINLLIVVMKKLKGKNPLPNFYIFIRVWPDKYRMDLDEIKRCPSSHLVNDTGEIIPFCYGVTLNSNIPLL